MRVIGLVLILIMLTYCSSKKKAHIYLEAIINEYEPNIELSRFKVCIIIPLEGCQPCIQKTKFFVKENISNENLLVIVNSESKKRIDMEFSSYKTNHFNFIADHKDLSRVYGLVNTGPSVLFYNNGEIIDYLQINNSTDTENLFSLILDHCKN